MCDKEGCDKPGNYSVVFMIPAIFSSDDPGSCSTMYAGIAVCREHAQEQIDDIGPHTFPEESQTRIKESLRAMGRMPPDFKRMYGVMIRTDSEQYQTYLRLTRKQ